MKPNYRLISSYQQGLAGFGVVLMDLRPGTKQPTRGWDYYDHLHQVRRRTRLDLLPKWLQAGGAMYRPSGGLWTLDCDDLETTRLTEDWLKQQGLECPKVGTPSGGCHFPFQFPEGLDAQLMKAHVCGAGGRKWDFKLTDRTAVVMPGTTNAKGIYQPLVPWVSPPIVDPRDLEPSIQIFKDTTPFLEYFGSKGQRRFAAKGYLMNLWTKPAIAGKGGRSVLAEVACNLTRHYCQEPHNALAMLLREDADCRNWNQRCQNLDGTPYPWSEGELFDALQDSLDEVPSLGKALWKTKERDYLAWQKLAEFVKGLERQLKSDGPDSDPAAWVHTQQLYWHFLDTNGLGDDPPICLNYFSEYLSRSGMQIGRKKHRSAVMGVTLPQAPLGPN